MSTKTNPEGLRKTWNLSDIEPDFLLKESERMIQKYTQIYDKIGGLKKEEINFETCIKPLIDVECEYYCDESPLDFAKHSSTSKDIRKASADASKKLDEFSVDMSMRKDIFDNVVHFKENVGLGALSKEVVRFVEREITNGRRNGLHLEGELREKIVAIKKRMSDLSTDFQTNMSEDKTFLEFTREELAGVPEDLLNTFEKAESGKLKVTMKYPHFFPVTKKCHVPETRRKMEMAYQSKCMEVNTKILEELIQLRDEKAKLLGYENHAAFVLELRMAKSPKIVSGFLSGLAGKLQRLWAKERQEMLDLKKAECEKYGYAFNDQLDFWDMRYYTTLIEEQKYSVDQQKLREYFPLEKVTKGLFQIYQDLLGLKFEKLEGVETWHPEVEVYSVKDRSSGNLMGYFFLDFYPREGKYGHYAVFPLQPGCIKEDGSRQIGMCAMMCNFTKPTADKPSLLEHDEVETFFHEFGHVMHGICSLTETARFHGTSVERDFVEAPSQMLENWVWEEESLRLMSGHYVDNTPIPDDLLKKLMKSRIANAGAFNLRQIILGTADQRFHTKGQVDTAKVFHETYEEIMAISPLKDTNMPASWGHMCGYDSQYYGYMWSEVFSYDMFETKFRKQGILNPDIGMEYRTKILQPGGSRDASESLEDFLGREPNDAAFLRAKGLD